MDRADALKPGRRKDGPLPLARSELPIDTVSLARYLIAKVLVRKLPESVASNRIVETEAYVVGDAAGHAYQKSLSVISRCFSSVVTPMFISPTAAHTY